MELKKSIDFRKVTVVVYFVALTIYFLIGLTPAEATPYDVATEIEIPKIGLTSDVTLMKLENNKFDTPRTIVGAYKSADNKTFLVGHSSTVFNNLHDVAVGDEINYDLLKYTVTNVEILAKSEISMAELLSPAKEDTIVIMTCAGEYLDGNDATHRLIITALVQ